jgi:hypothetical protein
MNNVVYKETAVRRMSESFVPVVVPTLKNACEESFDKLNW